MMDSKNPSKLWTLLELIRLRNCIISFVGVLVGASLVTSSLGLHLLSQSIFLAAFAAFLITGGGNGINDYFDYEIDKVNKPNRPIPSRRITRSDALILSLSLLLLGLGFSKAVNVYALALALINVFVLVVYAKLSKKLLLVANVSISYLVSSVFVFGAVSVDNGSMLQNLVNLRLPIILTFCSFFITLAREIIKDVEDLEGDRRAYAKTLPIVLGVRASKQVGYVFALTAITISLIPILLQFQQLNLLFYSVFILVADIIFILSLTMYAPVAQRTMGIGMVVSLVAFFGGAVFV